MLSKLPEELLYLATRSLAYNPAYPSDSPSGAHFKNPSPELIALSAVNRQLRRISLPFLLIKYVVLYLSVSFIDQPRTIKLDTVYFPKKAGHEELCRLLPHLTRLACIDLQGYTSSVTLLNAVNKHSSVSAMIVESLYGLDYLRKPPSSLDLSKVVVECGSISHPGLETSYACGLKLYQLVIRQPESLKEEFGNSTFQGLHEISLAMNRQFADLLAGIARDA
ncbi:hypothetical protein F5876DRAFT_80315 [Lentinula aff. lateritia]|uniref:Uncharacterized protein n=1 Tax=Lentinula aff. lateritia TaxID=2804960 RepID=A0ACC1TQH0_9AGAR|nr:hypothetical protein F5876DRAFT_80315 [Lentinula aff. lateritia]